MKSYVYPVADDLKPFLLIELLRQNAFVNAVVFVRSSHRAQRCDNCKKTGTDIVRLEALLEDAQISVVLGGSNQKRCRFCILNDSYHVV